MHQKKVIEKQVGFLNSYQLIRGSSHHMKEIESRSTVLIFTSPPYFNARDYSQAIRDDLGRCDTYENYIYGLIPVWKECFRVLKPGGYLAVNIDNTTVDKKIYPCAVDVFFTILRKTDFELKENIYWRKQPQLGDKRGNHIKKNPYPRYYYPYRNVEPIYIFQKPGKTIARHKKDRDRLPEDVVLDWAFNDWFVAARDSLHPASFPEELAERLIRLYTETGELVGDPFAGSGTVMAVAKKWKRSAWSYEINKRFIPLIRNRIGWGQRSLTDSNKVDYIYTDRK
jgi:DNA modification methylase